MTPDLITENRGAPPAPLSPLVTLPEPQLARVRPQDVPNITRPVHGLFVPFGLLLLTLVGYNLLIHHTAKSSYRHHLLTSLSEIPLDTDFLFLGNSLVEAGCDPSAFRAAWPVSQKAP